MPGGVWIVSEGVWIESERVWGCINTKSVGRNVLKSCQLRYCLFFQCLLILKNAYLGGVWMVSDGVCGCLPDTPRYDPDHIWECLADVWGSLDVI